MLLSLSYEDRLDNSTAFFAHHTYKHLESMASKPFHVFLWFMVALMLLGNVVVVVWRCTRPSSQRNSSLSTIIVNLAAVDFLYGLHLVLIGSALVRPVFGLSSDTRLDSSPPISHPLCFAAYFISCVSCGGQTVAIASIAAYSFLSLNVRFQSTNIYKNFFVVGSTLTQWCLAVALSFYSTLASVWEVPWTVGNSTTQNPRNVEIYYVLTQCSFAGTLSPSIAVLATTVLTVVCVAVVLYIAFIVKAVYNLILKRRQRQPVGESKFLMIRLCLIVAVNILCWGPPQILYYFGKKKVSNVDMLLDDKYYRTITEATIVLLSIPPALNPLLYTIVTKPFLNVLKRLCKSGNDRMRVMSTMSETASLLPEEHITPDES
ncbi:uncharacterized protein LOC134195827 [Corticium candelabrum]|uniref:uncharacterized protein LOC134195827 n=1 Tax=Corticium candelabrum TaxID=121492 RepID=UPI002E264DD0|nr:uncharacterized protein LOC134195827 [Corticium candelabrum]